MKPYKIQKLDARFNGYPHFSHCINAIGQESILLNYPDRTATFLQMRIWFWETFGPSRELKFIRGADLGSIDLGWAWESEHNLRIYVRDKELNWFLLKWT